MAGILDALRAFRRAAWLRAAGACLFPLCLLAPTPLQSALANGDTRSLNMVHTHTGEHISITYKRDGRYDLKALKQLDWFLRDWRKGEAIEMDARLLDLVWEVARDLGGKEPIKVICGYRSEATNSMLHARSSAVAEHSQHTLGRAMDIAIPGIATERLREMGMLKQKGGVGYYPDAFVHLDVGNVRAWPRMSTEQLVRLFPSGETLHLPSDGPPLPGYQLALAKLGRDGKSGEGPLLAYAGRDNNAGRSILTAMFDISEREAPPASQKSFSVAAVAPKPPQEPQFTASLPRPVPSPRPQLVASLTPQPSALEAYIASLPKPLPRPPSMIAVAMNASLKPRPVELTALHFDRRSTAAFFASSFTERNAALTAPDLKLAAAHLGAPASAKGFGLRPWIKLGGFNAGRIRLAQN